MNKTDKNETLQIGYVKGFCEALRLSGLERLESFYSRLKAVQNGGCGNDNSRADEKDIKNEISFSQEDAYEAGFNEGYAKGFAVASRNMLLHGWQGTYRLLRRNGADSELAAKLLGLSESDAKLGESGYIDFPDIDNDEKWAEMPISIFDDGKC